MGCVCESKNEFGANNKEGNEELYNVAHDFFKFIFGKKGIKEKNFEIVEPISKQEKHSDILIKLNNGYFIIIEDKTYSDEHESGKSGEKQLEEYKKSIADKYNKEIAKIITVYYKIFDYDENFVNADVTITRQDILNLLNKNIKNSIYQDYKDRIDNIENRISEIGKIPIVEWNNRKELIYYFYCNEVMKNRKLRYGNCTRKYIY